MNRVASGNLPNFLVVGPPRTGTTWLYRCLLEHPQVFLPDVKQLHFFDRYFEKGVQWYKSFFTDTTARHEAFGEITPDYFSSIEAAKRIRETLGRIKIIVVYRDPVHRAFSHYKSHVRSGKYKHMPGVNSFSDALDHDDLLVQNGLYGCHIEMYLALFGNENVHILNFHDLETKPQDYLADLLSYLSVDPFFDFDPAMLSRKYAKSLPKARSRLVRALSVMIRNSLENRHIGRKWVMRMRDAGIIGVVQKTNSLKESISLSDADYRVAAQKFQSDTDKFFRLTTNLPSLSFQPLRPAFPRHSHTQ